MRLRLLSWNVRSLRDDRAAVVRVLRAARPDVVCIQEAPRFLRWRTRCAELAADAGLILAAGGRPAAAQLVLTRLGIDVAETRDVLLSHERGRGLHQRGLAIAVLRVGDRRIGVVSAHLDGVEEPRLRHIDEMLRVVADLGAPCAIGVDVNDEPDSRSWAVLTAHLVDGYAAAPAGGELTNPARAPGRRIDAVLVSPELRVAGCGVPLDLGDLTTASDHLPVLADLDLG